MGGAQEEGRLHGLQRENGRLQEQLRCSEELNNTLRSELDLHRSIMAQTSSHHQEQDQGHDQDGSGPQTDASKPDGDAGSQTDAGEQPRTMNSGKCAPRPLLLRFERLLCNLCLVFVKVQPLTKLFCVRVSLDLLGEHLQEIRALRQRLEESIRTNDRLREQLEKRLAEVEKDPGTVSLSMPACLTLLLVGSDDAVCVQQPPTSSSTATRSRVSWPTRCASSGDRTKP